MGHEQDRARSTGTESPSETGAELPLAGVRVLDLTDRTGVYCGKLLADIGADVIKVELPAGDDLRAKPPFRPGCPDGESSLLFAYYNNNKRGITLDWTRPEALPVLERLGATTQVVLISPSRKRPVVGFDDSSSWLSWTHDGAVVCGVTPYGLTGPWRHWRATPLTSFAASGQMYAMGPTEGPPIAMPGQQLYDLASTRAAIDVEAVLTSPRRPSREVIDIAVHNLGAWQLLMIERYAMIGRLQNRATNFGPPPGGLWECRDGFVDIAAHAPHHWDLFVELLGSPDDISEETFREREMRTMLFDVLTEMIEVHMRQQSAADFVERGQALGLPCALLYTPEEFLDDVQPRERGTLVGVEHEVLGPLRLPGPCVPGPGPLMAYRRPAPRLGGANTDIYVGELGFEPADLKEWADRDLI